MMTAILKMQISLHQATVTQQAAARYRPLHPNRARAEFDPQEEPGRFIVHKQGGA